MESYVDDNADINTSSKHSEWIGEENVIMFSSIPILEERIIQRERAIVASITPTSTSSQNPSPGELSIQNEGGLQREQEYLALVRQREERPSETHPMLQSLNRSHMRSLTSSIPISDTLEHSYRPMSEPLMESAHWIDSPTISRPVSTPGPPLPPKIPISGIYQDSAKRRDTSGPPILPKLAPSGTNEKDLRRTKQKLVPRKPVNSPQPSASSRLQTDSISNNSITIPRRAVLRPERSAEHQSILETAKSETQISVISTTHSHITQDSILNSEIISNPKRQSSPGSRLPEHPLLQDHRIASYYEEIERVSTAAASIKSSASKRIMPVLATKRDNWWVCRPWKGKCALFGGMILVVAFVVVPTLGSLSGMHII